MTGAEVVALRKTLSLSQKDLAARLDVEVAVVRAWEAGTMFPTLRHVTMLEGIRIHHGDTETRRDGISERDTSVPLCLRGESTSSGAEASADADFLAALRKALGNPELRAEIVRIASRYKYPLEK